LSGHVKIYQVTATQWLQLNVQAIEFADVLKQILHLFGSSSGHKRISPIARKSARKICASGRLIFTSHRDLVAVIKLRHATSREQKSVRKLKSLDRCSLLAHEPAVVVTAEQGYQNFRVVVEVVLCQRLRYFIEIFTLSERMSYRVEKRKVEQRIQARVRAVANVAALKI